MEKNRTQSAAAQSISLDQGMRWEIPRKGWMVLNTDGSAKGAVGPAGAGGAIRNDRGEWVMGYSEYLGHCSGLTAELKALLRGLRIAKQMSIKKLEIRVDSKRVVGLMTDQWNDQPNHHFLVQQCTQFLRDEDWEVTITHCFRETNQVADILANIGITKNVGVVMYQTPPMEVQSILYYDRLGFLWPRHSS